MKIVFARCQSWILVVVALVGLQGCASYHTHYAMFPAENSAGETRQVRVSWQSAEYPAWWISGNKATPIRLETQCSDRIWRIIDDSHEGGGDCAGDVRACGEPGLDILAATGQPASTQDACLWVQTPEGVVSVAELGTRFSLVVSCQPKAATVMQDGDTVNQDYLRSSPVPYIVHARKVPRGTLSASLPSFNQSECKEG